MHLKILSSTILRFGNAPHCTLLEWIKQPTRFSPCCAQKDRPPLDDKGWFLLGKKDCNTTQEAETCSATCVALWVRIILQAYRTHCIFFKNAFSCCPHNLRCCCLQLFTSQAISNMFPECSNIKVNSTHLEHRKASHLAVVLRADRRESSFPV